MIAWLKWHSWVTGNESEHYLAKYLLLKDVKNYYNPILYSLSFLRKIISKSINILCEIMAKLLGLLTGIGPVNLYFNQQRKFRSQIHRIDSFLFLLTGHGSFTKFQYKLNKLHTNESDWVSNDNSLHYFYQNCPLMLNHFKCNILVTLKQMFLILIALTILIK